MSVANESRESRPRFPLLYVAVLAGFVAAACPLLALGLTGVAWGAVAPFLVPVSLLAPASACAALVTISAALPMHFVIVRIRLASAWTYIAGMLVIIGLIYLMLFSDDVDLATAFLHPVGTLFILVPIAAIPSGLFFYRVAHRMRSVAPVGRPDALIVATWFGAWIMMSLSVGMTHHSAPDPLHTRAEIVRLASAYGTGAFMLAGAFAGLARLRSVRLGALIAAGGWLIPLGFSLAYFATPLGPDKIRFKTAGRSFTIDWHFDPRREGAGFNFDATRRGPYEFAGRRQLNRRIRISAAGGELSPQWLPSIGSSEEIVPQWSEAGLKCAQREIDRKPRQICVALDDAGHTTTLIECGPGYCFHRFDLGGLRYGLLIDRDDLRDWMEIQKRTVQLLADVNQPAGPD